MNIKWILILAGVLLLLAIPNNFWPSSYYVLLRWVIFIVSIVGAYGYYKSNVIAWVLVLGSIAFIFNPIVPVYLSKTSWVTIDFISAIIFFFSAHSIKDKNEKDI